MITPELITYLEKCEEMGVRKEETMSALLSAGWKLAQVQEGFKVMEARQLPMKQPRYLFPAFQLSLSLLFILVLGSGAVVFTSQYAGELAVKHQQALQANLIALPATPDPAEEEAQKIQAQVNRVSSVLDSLEAYRELTGQYPKKLEDLLQTANQIKPREANTTTAADYIYNNYGERPLYEGEFIDIFSGQPFVYRLTPGNYELSYMVNWENPQPPLIEEEFANGWNIATKDFFSTYQNQTSTSADAGSE